MEAKEAINHVKAALASLPKEQEVVQLSALNAYLDQLAQNAPVALQERELKHLTDLETYRATVASRMELFKATISTAQTALKTALLVNGGAAIAMLAFMGNIFSKVDRSAVIQMGLLHRLTPALICFTVGVALGASATATTYLAQSSFHYRQDKVGLIYRRISIGLVVLAHCAFILGIWQASSAFLY